jgi:hypothetical protein
VGGGSDPREAARATAEALRAEAAVARRQAEAARERERALRAVAGAHRREADAGSDGRERSFRLRHAALAEQQATPGEP